MSFHFCEVYHRFWFIVSELGFPILSGFDRNLIRTLVAREVVVTVC